MKKADRVTLIKENDPDTTKTVEHYCWGSDRKAKIPLKQAPDWQGRGMEVVVTLVGGDTHAGECIGLHSKARGQAENEMVYKFE